MQGGGWGPDVWQELCSNPIRHVPLVSLGLRALSVASVALTESESPSRLRHGRRAVTADHAFFI